MMMFAQRLAIRSIALREASCPLQMFPVLISFLYGLGVVGAAVITARPLTVLSASWTGEFPLLVAFLALGLMIGRRTREREPGRWPAFARRPALLFAALTLAAVFLLPLIVGAWGSGHPAGPLVAVLFAATSGFAGGQMLRFLVLYVGGWRSLRMHLWSSALTGAAAAPLLLRMLEPVPRGQEVFALTAAALILGGLLVKAVQATDMPVPDWESWRRGPLTAWGVLLVGVGFSSLTRSLLLEIEAEGVPGLLVPAALPVLLLFVVGAIFSNRLAPRLRRAGVRFGSMALFTAATFGVVESWIRNRNLDARIPVWFKLEAGDWCLESVRLLFRFGLPALFLGLGLAALPRLYGGLQFGDSILHDIPTEERRGPVGGAYRVGLFLLGIALGWPLFQAGLFSEPGRADGSRTIICLLSGGFLLVVFDPYAGIGRKLTILSVAGSAAAFGTICFF